MYSVPVLSAAKQGPHQGEAAWLRRSIPLRGASVDRLPPMSSPLRDQL